MGSRRDDEIGVNRERVGVLVGRGIRDGREMGRGAGNCRRRGARPIVRCEGAQKRRGEVVWRGLRDVFEAHFAKVDLYTNVLGVVKARRVCGWQRKRRYRKG